MISLQRLFSERRGVFEAEITSSNDTKVAYDASRALLFSLRQSALEALDERAQRLRLNQLMAAAEAGLSSMLSVDQVQLQMRVPMLPSSKPKTRMRIRAWLPRLACVPSALLCAYLYMDGSSVAPLALLCTLLSGACLLDSGTRLATRAQPEVVGEARVDALQLSRQLEHMLLGIDALMTEHAPEESAPLLLSKPMLEGIQMLMEARLQSDGQFALSALPQLLDALQGQGIEAQLYAPDTRMNFDLLPAPQGDATIRPALVKDGCLLVRGQATTKE